MMNIRDLFTENGVKETIDRINKLTAASKPAWGKMSVDQMLAHCNVAYDMSLVNGMYKKPGGFAKLMIKLFAKNTVVGPKPYPKNGRTAPDFVITGPKDFEAEKSKLVNYLMKVQELGSGYFHNRESHAMGKLSSKEWNVLFSKHLDHHLTQFNV